MKTTTFAAALILLCGIGLMAMLLLASRTLTKEPAAAGNTSVSSTLPRTPVNLATAFKRIAHVRIYDQQQWTLERQRPESVGALLASLKPTLVAGLVRVDNNRTPSAEQIAVYNAVRNSVLQANPDCKFDAVLDMRQYKTANAVVAQMEDINAKMTVDLWFFDYFNDGYSKNPAPADAAIAYAHSQGQLIGGRMTGNETLPNAGMNGNETLPNAGMTGSLTLPKADYAAVNDGDGLDKMHEDIKTIMQTLPLPILVYLSNDADNAGHNKAETFIRTWNTDQREEYLQQLDKDQTLWGYHIMYPVFYPTFPAKHSYDASQDGTMLGTINYLMESSA